MAKTSLALLALLTVVGSASAQLYRWDSGSSQTSLGLSQGGNVAWLQQFTVSGGFNQITSISTCFGTPASAGVSGVTVGQTFKVYVWKGTPTGSGVDTPTLLAQQTATVAAGTIDTDVLQSVAINATISGTSNFFIGASVNGAAGTFAAPMQTTGTGSFPIMDNSWVAGSATTDGFDPNNLAGGIGVLKMSTGVGIPTNWLLRATATAAPEPMTCTALVLGMAGLVARRRRARK